MTARRQSLVPPGSWPPRMRAEIAAAYCGEAHVEDFLERVGKVYPLPRWKESARRRFWSREELDRAIGLAEAPSQGLGARFREAYENRKKRHG